MKDSNVRRLLSLAAGEWRAISLGTVFLFLGSFATLAFPRVMGGLVDEALQTGTNRDLDRLAILMIVVFAVQGVATGLRAWVFTLVGERVVTRLRSDVYRHLMNQEIAFFDSRRTGELLNRLSSDTSVLQNSVSVNISMFLRNLVGVLGGIVLLLLSSPLLTALMLSVVPAVALGAVWFGRVVRRLSREVQDALARAGEVAEETIAAVRTVRAYNREPMEAGRYSSAVNDSFQLSARRASAVAWFSGAASFAGYAALAIVLWFGGRMVMDGSMTVGELTSFMVYTLMVAFSLAALAGLYSDFNRAVGAADRVFDLLEREPELAAPGGEKPAEVQGLVELRNVQFTYPARPEVEVLKGVSLRLQPGTVTALVGASGGGKSTIAALLCRFYDPTGGEILLDGRPLTTLDPVWLRDQIAVVEQEPTLLSTSIAANIRYGNPDASDEEVLEAARTANALDFVQRFPDGIHTQVGERGVQLSGGQKQRVAIARAVLKSPRILILDEATSALDAESEHLVREALERLMVGRTTLVIAHRLSTVREADQVAVIQLGELNEIGTHAELLKHDGQYRRLVERQLA
jgi:ABC transporter fused permease/ATP-binding protein